jgi:DNA-binding NtrC family response regulator
MDIRINLLIVDDDQVCREILRDALASLKIDVVLAGDGIEGLEKLAAEPFDILITDLNMPRMDGMTLLREARERYPHILTIIVTGFGSLGSATEAIRSGAYDYIQKPFKIEEILIVTRNAIEKIKILREKNLILEELASAYRKLHALETQRKEGANHSGKDLSKAHSADANALLLFPRHTLPLSFFERPPDEPDRVLGVLERLKILRQQGIINDDELRRLKKGVLERMDD